VWERGGDLACLGLVVGTGVKVRGAGLWNRMRSGCIAESMNQRILILVGAVCLMPLLEAGIEPAQVRLYCYSVRMDRGGSGFGGTLDVSTLDWSVPANGELAPLFRDYSHGSGFSLNAPGFLEPIRGGERRVGLTNKS
jgi:hypothetical protein